MSRFKINHVAMAVPAADSIESFLKRTAVVFGDFEQRGVLTNDRQAVREQFLSDGHTTIELLEPIGERSPLRSFLHRNPHGGLVHVALDVEALERALAELAAAGAKLVSRPTSDIAFQGRRIAFVLLAGQLVEVIERDV
jgi:methylmalonyl-CoA/ethylmalonyl-CoA epimerase